MDEEGALKTALRVDFATGGSVDWGWTDWIGLVALLLAAALLLTVIVALVRGESPLKILRQICIPLTSLVKRIPG
jgi:hypothetical protein